jgi:pyruvate formate lyase activating enzyme
MNTKGTCACIVEGGPALTCHKPAASELFESKAGKLQCQLCPHTCLLAPGETGKCSVRQNIDGQLVSTNYGRLTALTLDPIEKKPLYHFYPGHLILSVSSFGCNLSCDYCQNWKLSQGQPDTRYAKPEVVVNKLAEAREACVGVAYTFAEPLVWYEYVRETARLVHERGAQNVLVTNGFINPEPLDKLLPFIGAANVDLKGFTDSFYARVCGGRLQPVKHSIRELVRAGVHVEVTTLIIPGENDDKTELNQLYEWLGSLDETIPVHVARYFPAHERTTEATPPSTLTAAAEIAEKYLQHVYIGNLTFSNKSDTCCSSCGAVLIRRSGYSISLPAQVKEGHCGSCGAPVPYIGSARERNL